MSNLEDSVSFTLATNRTCKLILPPLLKQSECNAIQRVLQTLVQSIDAPPDYLPVHRSTLEPTKCAKNF